MFEAKYYIASYVLYLLSGASYSSYLLARRIAAAATVSIGSTPPMRMAGSIAK